MADYGTIHGTVEFEPEDKKIGTATVRKFTIRSAASQNNVYVTLWPPAHKTVIKRGDSVTVSGKFNEFGDNLGVDVGSKFTSISVVPGTLFLGDDEPVKKATPKKKVVA